MIPLHFLQSVALFEKIEKKFLAEIQHQASVKEIHADEILYHEKQDIKNLTFLLSGQLESYVLSQTGQKRVLEIIYPVDTLGEAELITHAPASSTVCCIYPGKVLHIPKVLFKKLWSQSKVFHDQVVQWMALNQIHINNQISDEITCRFVAVILEERDIGHLEQVKRYLEKYLRKTVKLVDAGAHPAEETIKDYKKKFDTVILHCRPTDLKNSSEHLDLCHKIINLTQAKVEGVMMENPHLLSGTWETPGYTERIARACVNLSVGLALSSGTAHGLAHLGILKTLITHNMPIDMIAGCSGGAIYSAPFALGLNPKHIEKHFIKVFEKGLKPYLDWVLPIRRVIRGKKFIEKIITPLMGQHSFEELQIPFVTVSTDLNSGQEVVFDSGKIQDAIRASISIPAIFEPVMSTKGRVLVDGVVTSPIPVKTLRRMGLDIVIAVHVSDIDPFAPNKVPSILTTFMRARAVTTDLLAELACVHADYVSRPQLQHVGNGDYHKVREIIRVGERSAEPIIEFLKKIFVV